MSNTESVSTFVETWDTLLKHFCSRDDLRLGMCQPNIVGDFVYATDAHSWIKVPYRPSFRNYGRHEKTPNFDGVSCTWQFIDPIIISKKAIEDALSHFDKKPDWDECKKCEGTGIVECKCCGSELECKECDGEGTFDNYTLPEVYDDGHLDKCIEVLANVVAPFQIGRLLRAMDFIGVNEIELRTNKHEKGLVFYAKDIEIVVMPLLGSTEFKKVIKLGI